MASSRTDPDCVPILQYLWNHGDERTDDSYFEDRPELQAWTHHGNGTPLYNAASSGNKEAVEWLLLHGADPGKRTKCRDRVGDLPIDAAIHKNHTDVVEMLTQVTVVTPEVRNQRIPTIPSTQTTEVVPDSSEAATRFVPARLLGNGKSNASNFAL